ncbi:MAG TPA: tubulin-like doman-containing protein, partial [Stenomitos sp.]
DTEQNAKATEPQVVLKQDISLRPVEQVWAKVENAKAILNNLSSYPYLSEWFPPQLKGTDSILAGAGQVRALGKFAFTVNFPQIKAAFQDAKRRIVGHEKFMLDKWKVELDKGINIFIVSSFSGGTGSGMFLDLAYNVRDWVPASEIPQTSAYMLLPGAFSGLGDRVIANAYAALLELNHYSRSDTRFEAQYTTSGSDRISPNSGKDTPFSFCYLVGNSNDKVTLPSVSAVLEMVAQNVFLDFSSGFSQYKKLVRDNIRMHWSSADPLGFPQNFLTFGLSSIQFPVDRVLNACAARLARQVVAWWQNPTPSPAAMRDVIKTEILPNLKLAESENDHQIIDGISLGDNMKPYSKEVADWVANVRKRRNDLNIPFENLQKFVSVEQEKYAPHFNDSHPDPKFWSDYFQKMWDNLQMLIPQKRQALRQTVYSLLEDRFRGPKFTRQFLEVLQEVLTDYRNQFDQARQKDWLPKEKSAANALQALLKQIDDHARQMLLLNRRGVIDEDFKNILQALELTYVSKVEVKARTLGVMLLDELKQEVNTLLSDLTAFDRVLEALQTTLAERENVYVQETGTLTVNGILLYDAKDIDLVYRQTLGDRESTICQSISQDILNAVSSRLFDLYGFDTLRVKDLFERLLGRTQDEFKTSAQVNISTARKFLERYPTLDQQEAQLKTTFQKSEPFLRFSKEQVSLGWDDVAEKRQKLVGVQGGTKPTDPAVDAVLPILRKVSALDDKNIKPLNDPHRVYFIHEVGAFPLRLIEGIDKMRTVYRSIGQADTNPLHTHQDQRQFKDLLPAPQEEAQVKQNLRLGIALGLIYTVENRATGYTEVRLRYADKQTGLEQTQTLGATLQEAEDALLSDAAVNLRNILSDALVHIGRSAINKPDKQSLYQRLIDFLAQYKQNLPNGEDNPAYGPAKMAIETFIRTYSLFIAPAVESGPSVQSATPSATVVPTPPPPVPSTPTPMAAAPATATSNENIEKFRKLAQTCYKKGQPTETELQLLEKFRDKYGLSPAQADQIVAELMPKTAQSDPVQEYSLMYRAFVENDGDIDLEEQAQLLELQEELGLTFEQANIIEQNIREELGLST